MGFRAPTGPQTPLSLPAYGRMRPSARCQERRQFCVAGRQRFCAPPLPRLDDRRDILHMRLQNARFSAAKGRWLPWPFHGVWQIRPYAVHPGGRRCADSQSGAASTWHGQYTPAPEHFRNAGPETGICRPPFQEQACIFAQGLLHALLAFPCPGACLKRKKIRNLEGISRWFSRRIRSAKMAQKTPKLRSREFSNTPQSATPWFFAAGLEKRPQICYNHLYAHKMSKRRYKACRKTAGGSESFTAN